ncbi:MAG: hypothetical protein R6U21_01485 [Thermoplasmatota archaeon]
MTSSTRVFKEYSSAFAPGHISGFFQPMYHETNELLTGSRGAGLSVSLGCQSRVKVKETRNQRITIFSDKKQIKIPVITKSLQNLIGKAPLEITVNNSVQLPIGQGFGMSAASSLAAAYATADCLQIPFKKAVVAAHRAEVQLQSGLGDVIASASGGIEIRKQPGICPDNPIIHIPGSLDVVLCVIDSPVDTKKILTDEKKADKIALIGKKCTDDLLTNPTIENLFSLSLYFAQKTGLASDQMESILEEINEVGLASMCMLGNSIFAIGNKERLMNKLKPYGKIFLSTVDTKGARIII